MKSLSRLFGILVIVALLGTSLIANGARPAIANQATAAATESGIFPRTVVDGAGNSITIPAMPVKIVSVSLASDEILLSLVDHSRLLAVTSNALDETQSNVAEAAKTIPNQLAKADPEAIVALKPDLVFISSFTDAGVVKQIKDAGVPVYLLTGFNSIKDIETNIINMGTVTGNETAAAAIVGKMEARLTEIANAVKGAKQPATVMYYAPGGYSDGPGTTVDELITRAGAVNIVTAGGVKDQFPQVSDEFVVKQDPDYILLAGFNSYAPGFVDNFKKNPAFQTLKAIKNNHVIVANDAHITAVSQYIVEGVSDVAALLYPDLYVPQVATADAMSATLAATMSATAGK